MYAVRARLSASSIRATMRAVPFFSFRYNYVEARRRDFPNASIESIEQNSWIAIDLASPRNRRSTRLSDRNERNERKIRISLSLSIHIYIYRSLKRFFQFGWKFSRFIVDISWRTSVLDRRRSHNFHLPDSRWFPSAHMRLRLAIKDTPIKEINTARSVGRRKSN